MRHKRLHIQKVNSERMMNVIDFRTPLGLFLTKEGRKWVAVDNSTGDAWTEEFSRKRQAFRWLRGEFEVDDGIKNWVGIDTPEELIAAAVRQGVELNTKEADTILGYLEGHDYRLMVDADGATVRHDMQYGENHRSDEPYTIEDTVEFCREMNDELLNDSYGSYGQDKEYVAQLRKDEKLLDALAAKLIQHLLNIKEELTSNGREAG